MRHWVKDHGPVARERVLGGARAGLGIEVVPHDEVERAVDRHRTVEGSTQARPHCATNRSSKDDAEDKEEDEDEDEEALPPPKALAEPARSDSTKSKDAF